ncbi:MAG: LPS export ABC transporter permease LptG [Gammaproteobacteria bacterium]
MRIIQKYITINLVSLTLLALFALSALFLFFSLIDQLGDTGRGHYGIRQALMYVLLTAPRLAYELFPVAAVIGSMAALGILARNSELAVIRTSGVSRLDLAYALAKGGMILVIIAIIIGELIAPVSEEKAQHMRSMAMSKQIVLKTHYGFWARDGNSYINIRKILPGERVEQVYIYEFDDSNQLRNSTFARVGSYAHGQWQLQDIEQTILAEDKISKRHLKRAAWASLLDPQMINFVTIKPQYLTVWGLFRYIAFLEQNAQNTLLYEQALWIKLTRPFSIIAMLLLAVPLVQSNSRVTLVGQRVFVGTLIGIVFHLCNQTAAQLGVVYNIPSSISVTLPTVLLLAMIFWLLRK